jgi:hypothetical protein
LKVEIVNSSRIEEFHTLSSGSIFSSAGWCNCFDDKLVRFFLLDENEKPIGGFVAYEGGKVRFKTLITAPYAPHIGLFVLESKNKPVKINTFRKEVIEAIADYLKESTYVYFELNFAPEWNDMQPMIWKKITTSVRYTYQIDLHQSIEVINENLDSSKRNKINKAQREGLVISHQPDSSVAYHMISDNFTSNSLKVHSDILKNLLAFAAKGDNGIYTQTTFGGGAMAINICVKDSKTTYNLLSAIDRRKRQSHAGTYGLYHSILRSKEQGQKIFDFEGSGVPEIEEFFRSFGGSIIPYFSVTGGKWPWPMIMKWRK